LAKVNEFLIVLPNINNLVMTAKKNKSPPILDL